ncbi:MAG: hypothetical protein ACKO37_02865 [Vampirovibrionales bacterium]
MISLGGVGKAIGKGVKTLGKQAINQWIKQTPYGQAFTAAEKLKLLEGQNKTMLSKYF